MARFHPRITNPRCILASETEMSPARLFALACSWIALMAEPRTRPVSSLLIDVVGSTALQEADAAVMRQAFAGHDAHPNNLPRELTSFVGREREVAEVKRLLGMTRLLTLTGSGGVGKTRLVLRVASDLVGAFPDGVWLVELAGLGDPTLVPQATASALGVREQPGRSLLDTLIDVMRPRTCLLVLDNCEHLVAACATLANGLLRTCPGLTLLATSREPLGIAGESVWRVPPLTLPDGSGDDALADSPSTLARYEAIRLFEERARAALPAFSLTNQNAPAVVQICRRLDGIPLAIELAAARSRGLAPEQLSTRLNDRFRLLTGGSRTALARHQTLRALVDWSYELLSEPERVLLQRLSVFAGGWTLDAAEVVCAGDDLETGDVLELLLQLVDRSLVLAEDTDAGRTPGVRYRLLETLRQYGAEKLYEAGDEDVMRGRHLSWCLGLAEVAGPSLRSRGTTDQDRRLDVEHDNLRAALGWSLMSETSDEIRFRGQQLAEELAISDRTASTHVTHILNKLGFSTRSQVAAWAVERGLAR